MKATGGEHVTFVMSFVHRETILNFNNMYISNQLFNYFLSKYSF